MHIPFSSICYFLYTQISTNKGYIFFFFQENLLWIGINSCIVKSCNLRCHCNIETKHSNSNRVYIYNQLPIILCFHQVQSLYLKRTNLCASTKESEKQSLKWPTITFGNNWQKTYRCGGFFWQKFSSQKLMMLNKHSSV